MRAGIVVNVTRADRHRLEAIVSDRSAPQKHVWRANIVERPSRLPGPPAMPHRDSWRITGHSRSRGNSSDGKPQQAKRCREARARLGRIATPAGPCAHYTKRRTTPADRRSLGRVNFRPVGDRNSVQRILMSIHGPLVPSSLRSRTLIALPARTTINGVRPYTRHHMSNKAGIEDTA
jgi:hypothetical protein